MEIRDATLTDNVGICALMAGWPQGSAATAAATGAGTIKVRRVALVDGEIVGLLVGHHHFNGWRMLADYSRIPEEVSGSLITELFVHPQFRGAGIGSALVRSFMEDAAKLGRRMVIVQVDESDSQLSHKDRIAFFRERGFAWLTPSPHFLSAGRELMGWCPGVLPARDPGNLEEAGVVDES